MSKLIAEAHITISLEDGKEVVNVVAHRYNKTLRIQATSVVKAMGEVRRRLKTFEETGGSFAFEADLNSIA